MSPPSFQATAGDFQLLVPAGYRLARAVQNLRLAVEIGVLALADFCSVSNSRTGHAPVGCGFGLLALAAYARYFCP